MSLNASLKRRSRPGWLSEIRRPVDGEEVISSLTKQISIPAGSDFDSALIRRYFSVSCVRLDAVSVLVQSIAKHIRASVVPIGSFGDGTACKVHSGILSVTVEERTTDTQTIVEMLRLAGPSNGWIVECPRCDLVKIIPISIQHLKIHLYTEGGDHYLLRTRLVRIYTHLVDPSLSVLVCYLRSRLRRAVSDEELSPLEADYFLFILIWRVMIRERLLPKLIHQDSIADPDAVHDMSYWSTGDPNLYQWRIEGLGVRMRMDLKNIILLVYESLDIESMTSLRCPLTDEVILSNSETITHRIMIALTVDD